MSDDSSGLHVRQAPRSRAGDVKISDLTTMVRIPGRPAAIRVYTADEHGEAARYAAENGGEVIPLPLSPPDGYATGPDGSLVPLTPPES